VLVLCRRLEPADYEIALRSMSDTGEKYRVTWAYACSAITGIARRLTRRLTEVMAENLDPADLANFMSTLLE
jgi:hypothetical protein